MSASDDSIMQLLTLSTLLFTIVSAWDAPIYAGFDRVWQSTFSGNEGDLPDGRDWTIIIGNLGVNNELQTYTASPRNVQCSGGETLQLVPWREPAMMGGWTSGRIESRHLVTPAKGKVTMLEGEVRFGSSLASQKQGLWPAFWLLGESIHHGQGWPSCGELDIMETVNGQPLGHGTMHCDVFPGGICDESNGISGNVPIPDNGWHRWRIVWNRTPSDWRSETITWYMDGVQFHQIVGARIGNADVWATVAAKPLFVILNMAVGGTWPGPPSRNTVDGYESMMEVSYVAHYSSILSNSRARPACRS